MSYMAVFFFVDKSVNENYTLSLHAALPIFVSPALVPPRCAARDEEMLASTASPSARSEEHTSELQSHVNRVCRPLLEKKKPLKATSYMPEGSHVAKYVNKESDMDLVAKGLG